LRRGVTKYHQEEKWWWCNVMKYDIYGKDEDEPSSASDNIQQHQTNLNELHYSSPTSPFNNLQLPSNNQQPYDNLQQHGSSLVPGVT